MTPDLTPPYRTLFDEVVADRYATQTVYEHFVEGRKCSDKVNVVFRFDVDFGLSECRPLTSALRERKLTGSFYFLTDPDIHYDVWTTDIPETVHDRGFEVGVHTDHYYKQLMSGEDALESIRADVKRLETKIGGTVHGMVFHGHDGIDDFGTTNRAVYRDISPTELDLDYHDGPTSVYATDDEQFAADVEFQLSDFMGVVNAWQYYPSLPVRWLSQAEPGETVHFYIHPGNVFSNEVKGTVLERLVAFARVNQYRAKSPVRVE